MVHLVPDTILMLDSTTLRCRYVDSHQVVPLPGFGVPRSGFLSDHQDLHLLKTGVIPQLSLEGQLVFRRRFT